MLLSPTFEVIFFININIIIIFYIYLFIYFSIYCPIFIVPKQMLYGFQKKKKRKEYIYIFLSESQGLCLSVFIKRIIVFLIYCQRPQLLQHDT